MTVSTTTSAVVYTADGSTATFPYTWQIVQAADLVVYKTSADGLTLTLLALTTDYTVSGAGISTGGNVVLVAGNPAAGIKVFIASDPLQIQQLLLQQGTDFNPAQIMAALDLLTREMQATRRVANLGLRFPVSEALAGLTSVAPTAASRALKYPAFDASGNLVMSSGTGTAVTDGSITTPKFAPGAKAPLAGTADLATLATTATTAGVAAVAAAVAANGVDTAAIQDDAVDNTKLAEMPPATAKLCPVGSGTGEPVDGTGTQLNAIIRASVLTSRQRGVIAATTGRGLQYVSALDKILFAESAVNGRIMAIDPITDYPIPVYTSGITPKGLVYAANANLAASRLWMPNGTTNLTSVNPNTWATDQTGVGARCDYLLYGSVDGTLWGFDNGASKIREYNATTGVQIGGDYANANQIANTTDAPAVYVASNNSIYFTDLFGTVRRFNCTTHAITSLGILHTAASANGAWMMVGSDGLVYITNGGSTDKYKIKVVNPATDLVVATIDLSANLTTVTGFYWAYEWRGNLYAGVGGSSPTGIVCVIDFATRTLVDAIVRDVISPTTYGAGMAASPTTLRGYIGAAALLGFTSYLAFER